MENIVDESTNNEMDATSSQKSIEVKLAEWKSKYPGKKFKSAAANKPPLTCCYCGFKSQQRVVFNEHVLIHRDVHASFQCMDCGVSYMTEKLFCFHLWVVHHVSDPNSYIIDHHAKIERVEDGKFDVFIMGYLVQEHACKICTKPFPSFTMMKKHFRSHGLAFLQFNEPMNDKN